MSKRTDKSTREDRSGTDDTTGEEAIEAAREEVEPNPPGEGNHVTVGLADEAGPGDMRPTGEVITEDTVAGLDQAARNANLA